MPLRVWLRERGSSHRSSPNAGIRRCPLLRPFPPALGAGVEVKVPHTRLCSSRQAADLSPRPACSSASGRPDGQSLLVSLAMRTDRPTFGAIRFAGASQSGRGSGTRRGNSPMRCPRLLAACGRGDQPSPASGRKPAVPLSGLACARPANTRGWVVGGRGGGRESVMGGCGGNPLAKATYRCCRQGVTSDDVCDPACNQGVKDEPQNRRKWHARTACSSRPSRRRPRDPSVADRFAMTNVVVGGRRSRLRCFAATP
jgi:hypothetical protein